MGRVKDYYWDEINAMPDDNAPDPDLYHAYHEAYDAMMKYLDSLPTMQQRTRAQWAELSRLDHLCSIAKMRWENSQARK